MLGAFAGIALASGLIAAIGYRFHHDVMRVFEARERLRGGGVLVDVDTRGEFAERHPRLAINIPLEELSRRADELGSTSRPVVVYAHRWRRGMKAVHLLRSLGYQDVYDAAGARVKEKLSVAAAEADAGRVLRERERGVPQVELAPTSTGGVDAARP
jgi:rhodanese-related sulfurtransferase